MELKNISGTYRIDVHPVPNLTATVCTSVPVANTPQHKKKRTKPCEQCRELRCRCELIDASMCKKCAKSKKSCTGPTETRAKLEKMQRKKQELEAAILVKNKAARRRRGVAKSKAK